MLYCCDITEGKDVSPVRHGARHRHPCVRCHIKYEDMIKIEVTVATRVGADTIETLRCVEKLEEKAVKLAKTNKTEERRKSLEERGRLFLKQSLAEWPSFLEDMCGADGLVVADLYSIFTFEQLHNLHLGVSRLLKKCLVQYLSFETVFSHSLRPSGKRKKLSALKTPVLRACNSIVSHTEETYSLPRMHVDFAKKEKTEQLNGLFMKDELRVSLEGTDFYAVGMMFPFVAAFIGRCLGFEQQCDLIRMNLQYSNMINKVLVDRRDVGWKKEELSTLRSKIAEFKKEVKGVFESHCSSGLYTLKFHFLDHLVDDLESFESLSYKDSGAFQHFNVLIKQSYRMSSRKFSTRMEETVENMGRALRNVRRPRKGGKGGSGEGRRVKKLK